MWHRFFVLQFKKIDLNQINRFNGKKISDLNKMVKIKKITNPDLLYECDYDVIIISKLKFIICCYTGHRWKHVGVGRWWWCNAGRVRVVYQPMRSAVRAEKNACGWSLLSRWHWSMVETLGHWLLRWTGRSTWKATLDHTGLLTVSATQGRWG